MTAPKLVPALVGGLFMGVLSALPFVSLGNCCCLWIVGGGVVAAWVMQQNHPWPVSLADGATVGLLAGIVGSIVAVAVMIPVNVYLGPTMEEWARGAFPGGQRMPPEADEALRRMGHGVFMVLVGSTLVVVALVFSTLGGLVGAALFRRSPPMAPPSGAAPGFAAPPWTPIEPARPESPEPPLVEPPSGTSPDRT